MLIGLQLNVVKNSNGFTPSPISTYFFFDLGLLKAKKIGFLVYSRRIRKIQIKLAEDVSSRFQRILPKN